MLYAAKEGLAHDVNASIAPASLCGGSVPHVDFNRAWMFVLFLI